MVRVTSEEPGVPTVDDVTSPSSIVRSLKPGGWYNFTVFSVGNEERVNEKGSEPLVIQTSSFVASSIALSINCDVFVFTDPRFPGRFVVNNFTTTSIGFWWRASYGLHCFMLFRNIRVWFCVLLGVINSQQ